MIPDGIRSRGVPRGEGGEQEPWLSQNVADFQFSQYWNVPKTHRINEN